MTAIKPNYLFAEEEKEDENDEHYLNQLQRFSVWIQDQGENVIPLDAKYARTRRLIARFLNTMAIHITIIVLASLDALILIAVQLLTIEGLKALLDKSSVCRSAAYRSVCDSILYKLK
ncbi:hypothetical protein AHF37_10852 [Paragonimus kellicotti]|nr:hypothetical protein AHF37_10852 [Paragonimus kellicotti]